MLDAFDFYQITARSSRKRDLIATDGTRPEIRTTLHWHPGSRYPDREHVATVAFVDVHDRSTYRARLNEAVRAAEARYPNAHIHVNLVTR